MLNGAEGARTPGLRIANGKIRVLWSTEKHVNDDVKHLARVIPFDLDLLRNRFEAEMRPTLGNPDREARTLQLWIEAITEERSRAS